MRPAAGRPSSLVHPLQADAVDHQSSQDESLNLTNDNQAIRLLEAAEKLPIQFGTSSGAQHTGLSGSGIVGNGRFLINSFTAIICPLVQSEGGFDSTARSFVWQLMQSITDLNRID